jgi:preprotein translocase subunit YajC
MLKTGFFTGLLMTALVLVGGCVTAPAPEGGEQPFNWTIIIFLVVIFGLFYFVMIRPQRKRQKQHEMMVRELQKGDKVITAGGIYGTIDSMSDDSIVIKIESGATLRVARGSVIGRREK